VQALRVTLLLLILAACVDDPVGIGVLGIAVDGAGSDTVWVGAPGELVASGVRLHITDGDGRALPGASIEWEAIGRNAQLIAATPKSNAGGVATAAWQLGTDAAEEQVLRATVRSHGTEGQIVIRARAVPHVVEQVRQTLGKEVPRELAYEAARQTWKEWIHNRASDLSAVDLRVLFGHFEFQGVRYASTAPSEVVPNDFTFTPEMVPDAVDLVVFGHIHMHQTIDRKIVYVGAPERIDWGERLDPKGFLALRPEGTWSFIELPARPMDKVEVVVGMGDDVTETVLAALPAEVGGHLVRIEITLPDELRNRLDEKRLADRLRDAFHYEVKFVSSSRPRVVTDEFTLDPGRLLSDYVDKVLADHPKREAIKVEARRVLKEALA